MFKNLTDTDKDILISFAENNMSISETARKQYLHRNTIVYHLERVKSKTGLNPFNFYQLVQLMELAGVISLQCKYFKKEV